MLSASTYEPSDFQTKDPAATTEVQLGAAYLGATQRSLLCVAVGGREVDLSGWALAACLKQSFESTGRPGTLVSLGAAEKARIQRAYQAVAPAARTMPLSNAPPSGFQDQVLVVSLLEELDVTVARDIGAQAGNLLEAFANGSPQGPPPLAAPLVLAGSRSPGTAGLAQLHASLWALQNAEATATPVAHDDQAAADDFGLGITTSLMPGSAVQYEGQHQIVWEVDRASREAGERGGRVTLVTPGRVMRDVDALRCAPSEHPTPYYTVGPDAQLNVTGGIRVPLAAKGAGVRFGEAQSVAAPASLLQGHCSFMDAAPRILRPTRWGVWAPPQPSDTHHPAHEAPPLMRDFAWGPAGPVKLEALQDYYSLGALSLRQWDMARNIAYSAFYYEACRSHHVLFPGASVAVHLRLSQQEPPTDIGELVAFDGAEAYAKRFDLLPVGPVVRAAMSAMIEAFYPGDDETKSLEALRLLRDIDYEQRGHGNAPSGVAAMRSELSDRLWANVAADWSKSDGMQRVLSQGTAITYCDFSCRLLQFAATARLANGLVGAVEDGDDTRPLDPTALNELQVVQVDQTVWSHVVGQDIPSTLVLCQPPPTRASLLAAVEQISRAFVPSTDRTVLLLLTRSPGGTAGFKTLASSVDIASFLGGASGPAGAPPEATSAWAAATAARADGGLQISQFASSELAARIESVVGGLSQEVVEWKALLQTARGLPEWTLFHARVNSLEGPGDLDKLPPDEVAVESAPSIDVVRRALAGHAAKSSGKGVGKGVGKGAGKGAGKGLGKGVGAAPSDPPASETSDRSSATSGATSATSGGSSGSQKSGVRRLAQHIGGVADHAARSYVSGDTSLGDRVTAGATRGAIGGLAKGVAVGLLAGAGVATGVISPSTGASVMTPLAAGAAGGLVGGAGKAAAVHAASRAADVVSSMSSKVRGLRKGARQWLYGPDQRFHDSQDAPA